MSTSFLVEQIVEGLAVFNVKSYEDESKIQVNKQVRAHLPVAGPKKRHQKFKVATRYAF